MSHFKKIHVKRSFEDGAIIHASSLSGQIGLIHGFTTRNAGNILDENTSSRLLRQTGMQELRLLTQVHGKEIIRTSEMRHLPEGDGWFGEGVAGVLYGIKTADCLPLLLFDPITKHLAALHCGWRSTLAEIVPSALDLFQSIGVNIGNLLCAIGPALGPCCFEVGAEFEKMVDDSYLKPADGGKFYLDLPSLVKGQLLNGGVAEDSIEDTGLCTLCEDSSFFSHRRSGEKERMCSFIGVRGE